MNAPVLRDSTAAPMGQGVMPLPKPHNLGIDWDAENQLVSTTIGAHRTEYFYYGLQRRVRVFEKENGATQTEVRLLWCDALLCEEREANGTTARSRLIEQRREILFTETREDHAAHVPPTSQSRASSRRVWPA